jgi:methionyl aminopeptidase
VIFRTDKDIKKFRASNRLLAGVLAKVRAAVRPGATTRQLDTLAESEIRSNGGVPGFKGYGAAWGAPPFPATLCTSLNDIIVHGVPDDRPLEEGDLLSVDCGAILKGFYSDAAFTVEVGPETPARQRLIEASRRSMWAGIEKARVGNHIGDISAAIYGIVRSYGFDVARNLWGHGIGRNLHEPPDVRNYGVAGTGPKIESGLALAIETMVCEKSHVLITDQKDGWSVRTADGGLTSHYEHTVLITDDGPEPLTLFED